MWIGWPKARMVSSEQTILCRAKKSITAKPAIQQFNWVMCGLWHCELTYFIQNQVTNRSKWRSLSQMPPVRRAEWAHRRVCSIYSTHLGGVISANNSISVVCRNPLLQKKSYVKRAHPICTWLCWIYGRGVPGVAEELPSFTAQKW